MAKSVCQGVVVGLIVILFSGAIVSSPGAAQQTDTKWLLGKWQGEQWIGTGQFRSKVGIVFKEEAGKIQWELEVTVGVSSSSASGEATVSGNSVALQGKYYRGRAMGPLSYSLTRHGDDELTGTGIGSRQDSFQVAWRKAK